MVKVVLPCGFIYHEPPYTEDEVADLYRRTANIVSFTRPSGRRAAAESEPGEEEPGPGGDGAQASPRCPGVDPAPS